MSAVILIVDDDPVQRRLLEALARRFGYDARTAEDGADAIEALSQPGAAYDLMFLDLIMPGMDGIAVLEKMREMGVATPVIVQTANGSIEAVVSAMRAGAADFVVKPVGPERLQVSIRNALRTDALEGEIRRMARRATGSLTFRDLPSRSPAMAEALRLGARAAGSSIPVLIEGESGVGKELFARAITGSGERRGKPFVAVNCGAIPPHLVESILFGHEKGAFTGATDRHAGKFVEADGGTLFLDEVGELPPEAQVKLLRALQEGEVDPVGAKRPVKVDIRVLSATNRELAARARAGAFREDLYYRLNVFPIRVPPLRARKDDLADLARRFLARFAAEEDRPVRDISAAALDLLERYDWPGNVRQLENAVFRAVVLAESDVLRPADFPQISAQLGEEPERAPAPRFALADDLAEPELERRLEAPALPLFDASGQLRTLERLEADAIRYAIRHHRGQMTEVARRLGIGRSTLYRRIKDLGLDAECGGQGTDADEAVA
ncbi:sigma-54-dependent Fis family transcriptional regulator [Methylopila jiangsuensis]|uniref:DNA-binding transcriptional regulator NtrC n=1 Tax=Methylopila jiangsuensis TaxID=586230 RepID=A0A9W6N4E0_9HYPH|nr:sigma-54 dependent transcriptional regulator [Methylopila jiangsuensis]MDR6286593.1 DNA-binding NtrC family response regulator [Methylopila jiangsuensis]GLK77067.1 sigma-54-dependent Fis family transcriptional regulator [Methylopila jiangsuensis]